MRNTRWLTLPHAAEYLDLSVDALRRLVRQGKLPQPSKIGEDEGWFWSEDADTMLGGFQRTEEPQPDLSLAAKIIEAAQPLQATTSGVYFLICKSKIVYVGQAINVFARIGTHSKSSKEFDSWAWIPCAHSDLLTIEAEYIQKLRPPLNKAGLCGWIVKDD